MSRDSVPVLATGASVTPEKGSFLPLHRWLPAAPALFLFLYALGTPVDLPLGGRSLPIGPLDIAVTLAAFGLLAGQPRAVVLFTGAPFFAAYAAWALASTTWSIDAARSIGTAIPLAEAVVVYLVTEPVLRRLDPPSLSTPLRLFLVVLLAQMTASVLQAALTVDLSSPYSAFYAFKNAVQAPVGQSNHLAVYLEFILFYELLLSRPRALLFALASAAGIVMTFSRAGLAITALALIPLLAGAVGSRESRRLSGVFAALLAFGATFFLFSDLGRLLALGSSLIERTAESRIELWTLAWETSKDTPLLGIGYGAYEAIGSHRDVHNLLLELLCETGIIGLGLFGAGLLAQLYSLIKVRWESASAGHRREATALGYALGVLFAHSMVEPFFLDRSILWFAVLAASVTALASSSSAAHPTEAA